MNIKYFEKRGTIWMDFRGADKKRHRVPTGATTEAQARTVAPAILARVLSIHPTSETIPKMEKPAGPVGMTLREAFNKAGRDREKWLTAKDKAGKEMDFRGLLKAPGLTEDSDVSVLTREFMQNARALWIKQPGKRRGTTLSPSTINHRLSIASVLLEAANLPPHTVRFLSVTGNRRKRRTREQEIQAVIAWCIANHHRKFALDLADLIQVALSTTARRGELLALLWTDVYMTDGIVVYRDPKNGDSRQGALSPEVKVIFERRLSMGLKGPFYGVDARQLNNLWMDAREALGLKDDTEFVFHVATRHEGLSRLSDHGVSAFDIQAQGGHKSIVAASRYVRPSQQRLHELSKLASTQRWDTPTSGKDAEEK